MQRLLLVEFLTDVLRRNEFSMFYPFYQGLARQRGARVLWVCLGARPVQRQNHPDSRSLVVELPASDLAALREVAQAFDPTHVLTSELVTDDCKAALAGPSGAPRWMPSFIPKDVAAARAPGRHDPEITPHASRADMDPDSPRYCLRAGWFLDWMGLSQGPDDAPFLVESAPPDYGAVMANEEAWRSPRLVTLLGGYQCLNRMSLKDNPHFAGLDFDAAPDTPSQGCSFCGHGASPMNGPAADPVELAAQQLRRAVETSGAGGRNASHYDVYNIQLFRQFDTFMDRVVDLGVPPGVFYFSPRIDDVLRTADRIDRVLPRVAEARHEVRILSMGVENFSPRENVRFNKGIAIEQVDRFLELTGNWNRTWPGVFNPFKGGRPEVELGFILFTPWTTLADLRLNFQAGSDRGFPAAGFWLYSTLLIKRGTAMELLLRKEPDLQRDAFPDPGMIYGASKNLAELHGVVPWGFRDPAVAALFRVLVRVASWEREQGRHPVFNDDTDFDQVVQAYRQLQGPDRTPLALAWRLLESLESSPEVPSAGDLVRRCTEGRAAAPAPGVEARPAGTLTGQVVDIVHRLAPRLMANHPAGLVGLDIVGAREVVVDQGSAVQLELLLDDQPVTIFLKDPSSREAYYFATRRFKVAHGESQLQHEAGAQARLRMLVALIEGALDRRPAVPPPEPRP